MSMEEKETLNSYDENSIKTLEGLTHIRVRPGMYIGKLGDGASADDGIYLLTKEVIDNSIDEFASGFGKRIEIDVDFSERMVSVRDFGRGIPQGALLECVSIMNTGGKFDSKTFQKSVGMNGVGTKAVNALSSFFRAVSYRDGQAKEVVFSQGKLRHNAPIVPSEEPNGTLVQFIPDSEVFGNFKFREEYLETMVKNYAFLNRGLTLVYNRQKYTSKNGLLDLLVDVLENEPEYPIIHIMEENFEFAFTHTNKEYGEEYHSFVNGQFTSQGGTHQQAFREALLKVARDFYKKEYEPSDIRSGIVAAISLRIQEPLFESQTKTKLGSLNMEPDGSGPSVRNYINDIVKRNLDNYLHIHGDTAEAWLARIQQNERERKDIAGIKKIARERAKKTSLHNEKLRDCRIHYNSNHERRLETTLFITEGNSASGSITKSRDVNTQAVFSLRGKPLNCFGKDKKLVYQNEEFNLLQNALNIDEDLENLRYNNVVIATDADVDGMHIRMLLLTFFLQFFPDLVKSGHVYILQTPLFRVRNKQKTFYCYSEEEKASATEILKNNVEITRFKGLGEISPDEFGTFIGKEIRLDPILLSKDFKIKEVLNFHMGDNTPERQEFIIDNLRYEDQ